MKTANETDRPVRANPLPLEFPGVHWMGAEEVEAAARVLRSRSPFRYYGVDLQGEAEAFEREFGEFLGSGRALAVSSGTAALNVAMGALAVGPGQEVVIPAYLWVSVASAVVGRGAIPVLADVDNTFCMDPRAFEQCITPRTAGAVFVHMSGAPGRVDRIVEIARRRGLWVVEDCAQCAGGSLFGKKAGTFGDAAIFSFQMNKNMTSGEGGCFVTADDALYQRAFACHDLGYGRDSAGRLTQEPTLWGIGARLDEIRAAVLRVQLRKLPCIVAAMRASKYRIRQAVGRIPRIVTREIADPAGDTGAFLITTFETPATADAFCRALRAEGIVTFPQGISNIVMTDWGFHLYYNIPSLVHRASVDGRGFPWDLEANRESRYCYAKGACPTADSLFERSILLPIPSCLEERDESEIVRAFEKTAASLW